MREHLISMYRQLTVSSLVVAAVAMIAGCQSSSPAGQRPLASSPASSAATVGPAPVTGRTAALAGADRATFCALARARGAANLVTIQDQSAAGSGRRQILARLDVLTTAAPAGIRPDFVRLDHLEHALLGSGPPDRQTLSQVEDPFTITSLERIEHFLSASCEVGG